MSSKDRLDNVNPMLYDRTNDRVVTDADYDDSVEDPVDVREIFDLIRDINDPEHPLTLEQLNVVTEEQITVDDVKSDVRVMFTPTIPHCSMATLIGDQQIKAQIKLKNKPFTDKIDRKNMRGPLHLQNLKLFH